ncbi:hypothetical protein LguiB_020698 [Lonicera macranthoides]
MSSPLVSIVITLQAIEVILVGADKRQVKEEAIKLWVENLKDATYKIEDVLTEWNTAIVKLQIHGNPTATRFASPFLLSYRSTVCMCIMDLRKSCKIDDERDLHKERRRERFTVDWVELVWRFGEREEGGGRQGREGEGTGCGIKLELGFKLKWERRTR